METLNLKLSHISNYPQVPRQMVDIKTVWYSWGWRIGNPDYTPEDGWSVFEQRVMGWYSLDAPVGYGHTPPTDAVIIQIDNMFFSVEKLTI